MSDDGIRLKFDNNGGVSIDNNNENTSVCFSNEHCNHFEYDENGAQSWHCKVRGQSVLDIYYIEGKCPFGFWWRTYSHIKPDKKNLFALNSTLLAAERKRAIQREQNLLVRHRNNGSDTGD